MIDAVVGNQFDRFRSGVARFNHLLAEHLEVPVLDVGDERVARSTCPLVSVKFEELRGKQPERLIDHLEQRPNGTPHRVFLHDVAGRPVETRLVATAEIVYAGNEEVAQLVRASARQVEVLWSPATVLERRPFVPAEISVFSFGMAHKMRADTFRRLHELLNASGRTFALYVSNANHESVALEDAEPVYEAMHREFSSDLYFLGHLSDLAVSNLISATTYFAAFFPQGARANNSTVVAAMERGAVVITNLDSLSPRYLSHMETVIDINRCRDLPTDPAVMERMSVAAKEAARELSWERFAERFR